MYRKSTNATIAAKNFDRQTLYEFTKKLTKPKKCCWQRKIRQKLREKPPKRRPKCRLEIRKTKMLMNLVILNYDSLL